MGINDFGQVVGYNGNDLGNIATIWDGTTPIALNSLLDSTGAGWNLKQAHAINNLGQIAASGTFEGQDRAVLLTPTPEPASAVLLLGGAALLGLRRQR
jgi:hypothetical protein